MTNLCFDFDAPPSSLKGAPQQAPININCGQPTDRATGIMREVLMAHFRAGTSVAAVAAWYGVGVELVESAVRYFLSPVEDDDVGGDDFERGS